MLGLVGAVGATATVDVPDGTDVVWLEEPLLARCAPWPSRSIGGAGGAMSGLSRRRGTAPIARVTLARPEVRNAFDAELIAELRTTFDGVRPRAG